MADKRITYPKFKAFTASGAFASGYKLTTHEAGTSTLLTTYSDADLTTPNTNPIVLNSLGECNLYIDAPAKLTLTDMDDNVQTGWPIDDVDPTAYDAADITFDPTDTSYVATNVQTVIEEIYNDISSDPTFTANRVINSEAMIDQRNEGAAVTTTGSYPVDRFRVSWADTDELAISAQQSTGIGGLRNSIKVTATTAESDFDDTSEYIVPFQYRLLGYDVADLVNGATVTISFWFQSNHPNNSVFSVALRAGDVGKSFVTDFTYTTTATAQLVTKTITIPAHASDYVSDTTTGVGMDILVAAYAGTDYHGTADQWNSANDMCTDNENLTDWTQAVTGPADGYVQISGLQFRVGSSYVPLEMKTRSEYLDECLPYYQKSYYQGVAPGTGSVEEGCVCEFGTRNYLASSPGVTWKRDMVGTPTVTIYAPLSGNSGKATENVSDIDASSDRVSSSGMGNIDASGTNLALDLKWHYAANAEI